MITAILRALRMLKLIKLLPANNVPYGAAVDAVYLQNLKMKKNKKKPDKLCIIWILLKLNIFFYKYEFTYILSNI